MSHASQRSSRFLQLLQERLVILDGAMGTMIPRDLRANMDMLNLEQPQIIAAIHRRYLEAGADVISTNTFNSTAISQAAHGTASSVSEMNEAAARLARSIADETAGATGIPRFVAGVLGPTSRSVSRSREHQGSVFPPIDVDELTAAYAQACRALIQGGVDALLIETAVDVENARAALSAARGVMNDRLVELPLIVSAVLDGTGRTLSGHTPEAFWDSICKARPTMVGFNCVASGPRLRTAVAALASAADCGICLYPSAGLPNAAGDYGQTPADVAEVLQAFARDGLLNMVGGCCGTTPDHIRAVAAAVAGLPRHAYQGAGL